MPGRWKTGAWQRVSVGRKRANSGTASRFQRQESVAVPGSQSAGNTQAVRALEFFGRPVEIRFLPALTASRDTLLSRQDRGRPVHAGALIRKRLIILDSALLRNPGERDRILTHELFHFVWTRLANSVRRSWESLLDCELRAGRKGEAGWSAESRRAVLSVTDRRNRTRRWREYACESFCDTAAWLFVGSKRHAELTLQAAARAARRRWFRDNLRPNRLPI